jgi:uncharacterized protein (UPF0332 family)
MINENDREALIEYRLNQAFDTIELAKFLVSSDKLVIAVNRIYYGMYYALTALALKNKFETSKHGQLIGWFNKEFMPVRKLIQNLVKFYEMRFKTEQKVIMTLLLIFLQTRLS